MNDYNDDNNGNGNGNDEMTTTVYYPRKHRKVIHKNCLSKSASTTLRSDIATLKKADNVRIKYNCGVRNGGCMERIQSMIKPTCVKSKRHK